LKIMIRRPILFVLACILGGLGGLIGSIVGARAGKNGIVVGGLVGGLLGAIACAAIARGRGWIPADRFWWTTIGTALGFLAAAAIATHTLGSPIGPILSTLLIGVGALLGAGRERAL
jgi:phosphotransferase system  glucose/maltose/N-acetylglucosamine-specific IIC component